MTKPEGFRYVLDTYYRTTGTSYLSGAKILYFSGTEFYYFGFALRKFLE